MFRLGIFAAALLALGGCSDGCLNEMVSRADAPDGLKSAVMFQQNCGATTPFTTQISVLEPGEEPSGGGNAYVADADHGAATRGEWGGPWAEVTWIDDDTLLVRYASASRIFMQSQRVSGVRINYQEVQR